MSEELIANLESCCCEPAPECFYYFEPCDECGATGARRVDCDDWPAAPPIVGKAYSLGVISTLCYVHVAEDPGGTSPLDPDLVAGPFDECLECCPPDPPTGACCVDPATVDCVPDLTEAECAEQNGTWYEDQFCSDINDPGEPCNTQHPCIPGTGFDCSDNCFSSYIVDLPEVPFSDAGGANFECGCVVPECMAEVVGGVGCDYFGCITGANCGNTDLDCSDGPGFLCSQGGGAILACQMCPCEEADACGDAIYRWSGVEIHCAETNDRFECFALAEAGGFYQWRCRWRQSDPALCPDGEYQFIDAVPIENPECEPDTTALAATPVVVG